MLSPAIDTQPNNSAVRCIGPYEIMRDLGGGAMGTVYLARHKGSGETCALKVLPAHFLTHPSRLTRFKREVALSLKLDHPHIVRVLDAGLDDVNAGGSQFLVMEYLVGGSLRQQLRQMLLVNKAMPVVQALYITRQITLALDYLHKHHIVHRDVTPGNILCAGTANKINTDSTQSDSDQALYKLSDFGLVLEDGATRLSMAGGIGTAEYISPEAIMRLGKVDARSDLYSLGVVLYEMLIGRTPFAAEHVLATLHKHVHEPHRPIREMRSDVSPIVSAFVDRALAKQPAHRFQNAGEMIEAIDACLSPRRIWFKLPTRIVRLLRRRHGHGLPKMTPWMNVGLWVPRSAAVVASCSLIITVALGVHLSGWLRLEQLFNQATTFALALKPPISLSPTVSPQPTVPSSPATPSVISEPEPAHALAPAALHGLSVSDAPVMARHGPGLSYPIIATLPKSVRVPIIGRSADGKWWQIVISTATDGIILAWVSVTVLHTQGNESSVPQVWVVQEAQP